MNTDLREPNNFTEGKILGPLIRFALPVLLALLLQTMYGAVDLLVVGRFDTAAGVSAVSTGGQAMWTITALIVGLSMGTTVLLAQRIGEGRAAEGGRITGASAMLFLAAGLGISLLMQPLAGPFARLLQTPEAAYEGTVAYIRICSGGAVFIVAYNVLGSVFRGIGDSKMPLITVAIACVLNILGDLLLVAVIPLGPAGAAIATVFAQAVSVALSLLIIRRRKLPFTFARRDFRFHKDVIAQVVRLGAPIAAGDTLVSLSFLIIAAIVNALGVIPSAGVGVATRVTNFIMLVPSAYMQSMSAFVAQNIGANRPDRARLSLRYSILTSLLAGVVFAYFTFFHGDLFSAAFSRDGAVIRASTEYLKAFAIDCLLTSFLFCFMGYFNGRGKTGFVMVNGIVGAFLVRVPVSFLMSRSASVSLFQIGLATPCSTIVQILLCFLYLWYLNRQGDGEGA